MDDYLAVAVAVIMMAPLAWSDVRSRTTYNDITLSMTGVAACFFVYGFLTRYMHQDPLWLLLTFAGIGMAAAMLLMYFMRVCGLGDVAAAAIIAMMIPQVGGFPAAFAAIFCSYILGIAFTVSHNVCANMSDMARGRKYCRSMIYTHIKRRGERFCCRPASLSRIGSVGHDGDLLDADGGDLFVDEKVKGMPVTKSVPMVTMMFASLVGVSLLSLFGGIGGYLDFLK